MATSLYELFDIRADYTIDIQRRATDTLNDNEPVNNSCSLSLLSSQLLEKVSNIMSNIDASVVLVHGDTSSALISAMAAFYQKIPVAHVEAGLRSHNEYNPFPEEMNRVLIARLARWHFLPTQTTRKNLLDEGVADSKIHVVGNTIVEAAELGARKLNGNIGKYSGHNSGLIEEITPRLPKMKMIMVTVHRRENQETNIAFIAQAILELMKKHSDLLVVWPIHPNPVVQNAVHGALQNLPESILNRLYLTEPLDYPVLLWMLKNSWVVLTDSGGIQEEAVALHTPVLVLRDTTERPEIIEAGAGKLIGTDKQNIITQVDKLIYDTVLYQTMCKVNNPYGNGTTATKICKILYNDQSQEEFLQRTVSFKQAFMARKSHSLVLQQLILEKTKQFHKKHAVN
ncbi:MAG: UDP-N-acetylglucosamine 2-epimerase (non-hydrolyzing) [Gammaproteobacteria bacterium]|nr:UDP-N-acetylglucosamine 2-epimerase (non-hydrolyzing) [Gammaproteobacteria bacterium]